MTESTTNARFEELLGLLLDEEIIAGTKLRREGEDFQSFLQESTGLQI